MERQFLIFLVLLSAVTTFFSALPTVQAQSSVTFSVLTDRDIYRRGDIVHISLDATNTGTDPVTYTFTDSCSGFFFIIESSGSRVFSNVPEPGFCAPVITQITIQPGETRTVATLDWTSPDKFQGSSVTFTVTGVLHQDGDPDHTTTRLASKDIAVTKKPV